VIALADNRGNILSPLTIAPVNEVDIVLLPEGLKDLKRVAREAGLDLRGAVLNLDTGFDSKANRKSVFNAGMKPNIKENPRNRQKPKRGRKRFFDAVLYKLRFTIECTFAWEDKFKRLLLRFETKQIRHLGLQTYCFHAHQPQRVLWRLKLATSSIQRELVTCPVVELCRSRRFMRRHGRCSPSNRRRCLNQRRLRGWR
jgi:transposase